MKRMTNTCRFAIPKGQENENWKKTIFKKIMAENCSKLKKDLVEKSYQSQAM